MFYDNKIWMAKDDEPIYMLPSMANRHGLIAGATGTGKTITLKVMAESFSDAGVPVFLSDIKGDLSGMSYPGEDSENMRKRIERFGLAEAGFEYKGYPTCYWDVFGKKGSPVRATVGEMGPILLGKLMELTEVQIGVLEIAFKVADDQNLALLDFKDLKAIVQHVGEHAAEYKLQYGNVSTSSVGAIQRGLLRLENQGANDFFGEPSLDINDWMRTDKDGRGMINVLNCEKLYLQPSIYAAFMLWMLSELYESLPEVGDLEKPKMMFFFDEAHLLFDIASKELLRKIEQVVRLIRSKGVGVFFITQNPSDIPNNILSQLGNRIQHGLRAYTPADMKGLKTAADSFRTNPEFDTEEELQNLGTGEAIVSFLDEKGAPSIARMAKILPPQSLMGMLDEKILIKLLAFDEMEEKYREAVDRESAYELLTAKVEQNRQAEEEIKAQKEREANEAAQAQQYQDSAQYQDSTGATNYRTGSTGASNYRTGSSGGASNYATGGTVSYTQQEIDKIRENAKKEAKAEIREEQRKSTLKKSAQSIATSAGRTAANKIVRGILGNLFK